MRSLPPATVLVIERPAAPWTDYDDLIADEHSVEIVRTKEEIEAAPTDAYDLVFIEDFHPDIHVAGADHHLGSEAAVTLITDSAPTGTIDRACDDVLIRPVTAGALNQTIDRLRVRQAYVERSNEQFEVASRLVDVADEVDDPRTDDTYRALHSRLEELQAELMELIETLSRLGGAGELFHDLPSTQRVDPPPQPPAIAD